MSMMMQPGLSIDQALLYSNAGERPTAVPAFIGYTERTSDKLQRIQNFGEFEEVFGGPDPDGVGLLYFAVRHYFDNHGGPCHVLSIGAHGQLAEKRFARLAPASWDAVIGEPEVSLLLFPDMLVEAGVPVEGRDAAADLLMEIWADMLQQGRAGRPEIFCILDVPGDMASADACRSFVHAEAANGAAYWPHLETDYLHPDGRRVILPPSAAVAAAYCVADGSKGIWRAPANMQLAHVRRLCGTRQQGERLFDEQGVSINLIRSLVGSGAWIWGCRTLENQAASPWRYVQTRRLASYIETSLQAQLRFAVFEPNNALTWTKVQGIAQMWLQDLWEKGALVGAQRDEAFRIMIGAGESMTADDIEQGRMILQLHLALPYPAEFVQLRLQFVTLDSDPVALATAVYRS